MDGEGGAVASPGMDVIAPRLGVERRFGGGQGVLRRGAFSSIGDGGESGRGFAFPITGFGPEKVGEIVVEPASLLAPFSGAGFWNGEPPLWKG